MTTKPTIYLHIGAGKTGSTTIQVWLKQVEKALATAGYLIFDTNFKPHAHRDQLSNQQQYFHSVLESGPSALADFHEKFRENLMYMQQNGYHSAVLSAENLINEWTGAYTWFEPLLDACNWKIIAYVRNQPQYIVSAWKEWGYWRNNFEDLFNNQINADWLDALQPWDQRFGQNNIYLGILDKKCLVDGLLHHDFACAINTPQIVANDSDLVYANPSINNRSAIFFSKIRQQYVQRNPILLENSPSDSSVSQQELLQHALKTDASLNQMFHYKPLLISRAPVSGTHEIDAPLSILTTSMLDTIHQHFARSNKELLERYRPDLDVDVAFPRISESNTDKTSDIDIIFHGFHLTFESLRSLHNSVVSDEKQIRKNINNIHELQNSIKQLEHIVSTNLDIYSPQIQHFHHQQQKQLEMIGLLHQHTAKLWQDIQAHDQAFQQTQSQIIQIHAQIQSQQDQIQFLLNDLNDRRNIIKYWSLRIWQRIKSIFTAQEPK